jgi:hypothetical protein
MQESIAASRGGRSSVNDDESFGPPDWLGSPLYVRAIVQRVGSKMLGQVISLNIEYGLVSVRWEDGTTQTTASGNLEWADCSEDEWERHLEERASAGAQGSPD